MIFRPKVSCTSRSMLTRRPRTHCGPLASAPAAIRSSSKSRNSLTFGLFLVSATSEVLDDPAELCLAQLLVFHRAQHGGDEFVRFHNPFDVRRNLIAALGGQIVKGFVIARPLLQAQRA